MATIGRDIGIDLGTANTLLHVKGKGIVIREPSVVAVNKHTNQVLAVGDNAKDMLGRTPGNIVAIRPMQDGVIADYDVTISMLKHFIKKVCPRKFFFRPRVVICAPSCVTEVERRAIEESAIQAGAKEVYLIEEPMAASIGAGLPVEEPTGSMVVDIGGGTSEVAVISLGGIVTSCSLRVAGTTFDNAISSYVRKNHKILIGDRTAECVKIAIGSAYASGKERFTEVKGRDSFSGLPKSVVLSSEEIREALGEPVMQIIDSIKSTLEKTPPELAADIMENGIMLTGGGALLQGLDKLINKETNIPVHIAESPLDCVAVGTAAALNEMAVLKKHYNH